MRKLMRTGVVEPIEHRHDLLEILDLAIGLDLSLVATNDADEISRVRLQLSDVLLLTLRIERHRRNKQNRNDQQPVHKCPRLCQFSKQQSCQGRGPASRRASVGM